MPEHFRIKQTQVGELERGYDRQGQKRKFPGRHQFGLPPDFWQNSRIAAPRITFEQGLEIDLGRVTVKILHPGAASHTDGSSIVIVPGQDIPFSGDILFTDFHPFLGEGDFPGWNKALDMIAGQKVSRIVPGHGPLSGAKDLADMKEYLATFDARARELALP